ncbi:hypothetical protein FS749_011698 [Ceratobasidium sp. UAMH 11750]|nr:hypothetical protein FS749_011698 [Ceratobasidium sp. UAMH 11750]
MCSIGSVTISLDESFVAISTLQQSIVTYSLSEDGLILDSKVEIGFKEGTEYRPILPIAFTSNNLIMKGTTSEGVIPIFDPNTGTSASLNHGPRQTIRALTAHGDKVLVGSTDVSGDINASCSIKCYSSLTSEQQGVHNTQSK